ncbi:MAG: hypothetical protein JW726_15890 [Anaerolineales bacterium]|nr:hypothetical protein [Anaerolineales bacterium]
MSTQENNNSQDQEDINKSILSKVLLYAGEQKNWLDSWMAFAVLFLGGMVIPFAFDHFYHWIWSDVPSQAMNNVVTGIALIVWSLAGIIFIVKRDVPPATWISFRGIPAVLFGIVWTMFLGLLAIVGIIINLRKLFF